MNGRHRVGRVNGWHGPGAIHHSPTIRSEGFGCEAKVGKAEAAVRMVGRGWFW